MQALRVTPTLEIPAKDLAFRAVRSSGPGGQNVNKVATKVELRFNLQDCTVLSEATKARLRQMAARHIELDGQLVIACQVSRTQRQNLEQACAVLVQFIKRALVTPRKRKKTKPTAASKRARLDEKRRVSDKKQARRGVSHE